MYSFHPSSYIIYTLFELRATSKKILRIEVAGEYVVDKRQGDMDIYYEILIEQLDCFWLLIYVDCMKLVPT